MNAENSNPLFDADQQHKRALIAENATLKSELERLRNAMSRLMPWAGESPEGPSWATPEAKAKNRQEFEAAFTEATECFPEDWGHAKPAVNAANN
jgi:hypothetical protein